jgi:hypothetical protein
VCHSAVTSRKSGLSCKIMLPYFVIPNHNILQKQLFLIGITCQIHEEFNMTGIATVQYFAYEV